jgi:hypothetical protein
MYQALLDLTGKSKEYNIVIIPDKPECWWKQTYQKIISVQSAEAKYSSDIKETMIYSPW